MLAVKIDKESRTVVEDVIDDEQDVLQVHAVCLSVVPLIVPLNVSSAREMHRCVPPTC